MGPIILFSAVFATPLAVLAICRFFQARHDIEPGLWTEARGAGAMMFIAFNSCFCAIASMVPVGQYAIAFGDSLFYTLLPAVFVYGVAGMVVSAMSWWIASTVPALLVVFGRKFKHQRYA